VTAVWPPGVAGSIYLGLERTLVKVAHTDPGDTYAEITTRCPVMSTSAFLDAPRLRELAADLIERARLIEATSGRKPAAG